MSFSIMRNMPCPEKVWGVQGEFCVSRSLPILLVPDHNANKGRKKDGHSGQNDGDQTDGEKRWLEKGRSQGGF